MTMLIIEHNLDVLRVNRHLPLGRSSDALTFGGLLTLSLCAFSSV